MSSNSGENALGESHKAAEDIAALARRTPMITMLDIEAEQINRWQTPMWRPSEGLHTLAQMARIARHITDESASIKLPDAEMPATEDARPEFSVKEDITVSDVVEAIKQQLRPDEQ